jgi:hypothetical protein
MDGAGTLGGHHDAHPAGVLRVPDRHERGRLLVPGLHEGRVSAGPAQRAQDRVDAVPGVAEDTVDAPGAQAFDDEVRHEPLVFSHAPVRSR